MCACERSTASMDPASNEKSRFLCFGLLSSALEHTAVNKELLAAGREPVQRSGNFAGRAFKRQFHPRQEYPGDRAGLAQAGAQGLMRHGINQIIGGDLDAKRGELLVVFADRRPIPTNRPDPCCGRWRPSAGPCRRRCRAIAGLIAVLLISPAAAQILRAGHLIAVVQIVDGVEDRIVFGNVDDRPVRKNPLHAGHETSHSCVPWKSSHMKKPPRSKILAHLLRLLVRQFPVADFDRIQPGLVVDVVAVVQIHRLLHRAHVDARQPPQRLRKMAVRAGIVDGPAWSRPAFQLSPNLPPSPNSGRKQADTSGAQTPIRSFPDNRAGAGTFHIRGPGIRGRAAARPARRPAEQKTERR